MKNVLSGREYMHVCLHSATYSCKDNNPNDLLLQYISPSPRFFDLHLKSAAHTHTPARLSCIHPRMTYEGAQLNL